MSQTVFKLRSVFSCCPSRGWRPWRPKSIQMGWRIPQAGLLQHTEISVLETPAYTTQNNKSVESLSYQCIVRIMCHNEEIPGNGGNCLLLWYKLNVYLASWYVWVVRTPPLKDRTPLVVRTPLVFRTPLVVRTPPLKDRTPLVVRTPLVFRTPLVVRKPLVSGHLQTGHL